MTLKELKLFYKICQNSSLTKVAKEENISQSAVSIAIKSLEKKLNEPLFNRIGKKLILNQRGRRFFELSFEHYSHLLEAKEEFLSSTISGALKVSASKSIASYITPKLYFDFLSLHVDVDLKTSTQNSSQIIKDIQSGEADVGLIESECYEKDIVKEKFKDDELILVTSDERQKREVFIDSIDKKWILREDGSGTKDIFLQNIGEHVKIKPFLILNNFHEIKQVLIKNPTTISVISKIALLNELRERKLFEVKLKNISFFRHFYIIYHKNHHKNRLFCEFLDFIKMGV